MKKIIFTIAAALLLLCSSYAPKTLRSVTFESSVECKKCEQKVMENISFEKGVKDLKVNLEKQTVTVTFDEAKTDTTALGAAIRKLGYSARVSEYK